MMSSSSTPCLVNVSIAPLASPEVISSFHSLITKATLAPLQFGTFEESYSDKLDKDVAINIFLN